MSIQAMVDAMNNAAQQERSRYQMTLGKLIGKLEQMPPDVKVSIETPGLSVAFFHSYRGYYCDLALATSDKPMTVGALLSRAKDAVGEVFEGYKGGSYRMTPATPLWVADYGICSDLAVMDVELVGNEAVIRTRVIE